MIENPYQPPVDTSNTSRLEASEPIHARIQVTPEFILDSLHRFRLQRRHHFAWTVFRLFGATLFFAFAIGGVFIPNLYVSISGFVFSLACAFPTKIDDFFAARNVRRSPRNGELLALDISDAGFHAVSKLQDTKLAWASFTHWEKFDDGAIIFQSPKFFHWIPETSLTHDGDLERLFSLLESKLGG